MENLFFTHHHFDHNIDYPCFLLCRWDQAAGRGSELNVYGPKQTLEGLPLANVSPKKSDSAKCLKSEYHDNIRQMLTTHLVAVYITDIKIPC